MSFTGQVLGPKHLAMSVLDQTFPELGLAESELSEVSWVESAANFAGVSSVADLTNRQPGVGEYAKRKSDYVQAPISMQGAIEILRYMSTGPQGSIQLDPYGGAMARIGSAATPFPHRAGYLYSIQYAVSWNASDLDRAEEYIGWLRSFYGFMSSYVSKSREPRTSTTWTSTWEPMTGRMQPAERPVVSPWPVRHHGASVTSSRTLTGWFGPSLRWILKMCSTMHKAFLLYDMMIEGTKSMMMACNYQQ